MKEQTARPNPSHVAPVLAALAICAGVVRILACDTTAAGDTAREQAVSRARAFLDGETRGKEILGYIHPGADYLSYDFSRITPVRDGADGDFALIYRFRWKVTDPGFTDLAFLCSSTGVVYRTHVMDTDAVAHQPFLAADATLRVLGNSLIAMFEEKMTADDRRQLERLVDAADSKALLEWSLRFQQAVTA